MAKPEALPVVEDGSEGLSPFQRFERLAKILFRGREPRKKEAQSQKTRKPAPVKSSKLD